MPSLLTDYDLSYFERYGYFRDCTEDHNHEYPCFRNSAGYDINGYDRDGYDSEGYDSDGLDRDGNSRCNNGRCDCWECEQQSQDDRLHNYSYTPTLKFRGDKAPWFGMEIEVTADNVSRVIDVVVSHAPTLIYCKEDGSVQGAELVTHPMSYPWAMDNFPWEMLAELRTEAGASVIADDNGIHIHASRDGFDNSAHMYRWMKFWYRNPRDIQRIARRRASYWGRFNPDHRTAHKDHVKYGKPSYSPYNDATLNERYAAINTTNRETLEVRVFASTLRPQRARAALQLVAGSLEYTRHLTSEAITKRRGWEWQAFMAWAGKAGDYRDLMVEDRLRRYV